MGGAKFGDLQKSAQEVMSLLLKNKRSSFHRQGMKEVFFFFFLE